MTVSLARRLAGPALRRRAALRYRTGPLRSRYPRTGAELRESRLGRDWWYYGMELVPGEVVEGAHSPELPLLPRMMLRRCDVAGADCLDVGTMEGLVPVLLARRGARRVLAIDYSNHCVGKLAAVRHYHGVDFDYRTVGLMYELHRTLRRQSFDVINLSGLLYHVFSPLMVLAGVRPLVRRGGLVVASTNVILEPGPTMDFNVGGRLQREANTYWYPTVELFGYLLRLMRLMPIDALHLQHSNELFSRTHAADKPSGYLSVLCRAVDSAADDDWMRSLAAESWEYRDLSDWPRADRAPESRVTYSGPRDGGGIDLAAAIESAPPVETPAAESDSHVLRLAATE